MTGLRRPSVAIVVLATGSAVLAACGGGGGSTASKRTPDRTSDMHIADASSRSKDSAPRVPCPPAGATSTGTRSLGNDGTETDSTTSAGYRTVLSECTSALESAGWSVQGGGGGGDDGDGGGGLGATKGTANVQVQAGSNGSTTTVQVCSWPGTRSDDGCNAQDGQNQNQQNQNQDQNQQQDDQNQNQNDQNQNGS